MIEEAKLNRALFWKIWWAEPRRAFFHKKLEPKPSRAEPSFGSDPTLLPILKSDVICGWPLIPHAIPFWNLVSYYIQPTLLVLSSDYSCTVHKRPIEIHSDVVGSKLNTQLFWCFHESLLCVCPKSFLRHLWDSLKILWVFSESSVKEIGNF